MRPGFVQLGAGPIQRAMLADLVHRGVVPLVVDRSAAPAGLVRGALHFRAAIDAPDSIVRALAARPRDVDPVAVLSSTDLAVGSVPFVAQSLGLPHASFDSIAAMDDKVESKRRLASAGVRVPAGVVVERGAESALLEAGIDPTREWVVKPVDSSGSRGVARVRDRAAVDAAIARALEFSNRVLVEECIEGEHLDVNGLVRDGRFELVAVGPRRFTPPPACVPIFGWIPASRDLALEAQVIDCLQRAVTAFGYAHGPIKADLILDARGLVLIEAAARFHGDVFSFHTMAAAGRTPAARRWLAATAGFELPEDTPRTGAWLGIFADRAGEIRGVRGLAALRRSPGFRRWIGRLRVGDRVVAPNDNRALVGYGILSLEGEREGSETAAALRHARDRVRVRVEPQDHRARVESASV